MVRESLEVGGLVRLCDTKMWMARARDPQRSQTRSLACCHYFVLGLLLALARIAWA